MAAHAVLYSQRRHVFQGTLKAGLHSRDCLQPSALHPFFVSPREHATAICEVALELHVTSEVLQYLRDHMYMRFLREMVVCNNVKNCLS